MEEGTEAGPKWKVFSSLLSFQRRSWSWNTRIGDEETQFILLCPPALPQRQQLSITPRSQRQPGTVGREKRTQMHSTESRWCSPTSGSLGPEETTGTLTGSQAKKAQAKPLFLGNLLIKESPHRTSCLAVFKLSLSQDNLVAHPNSMAGAKTCLKHHLNPTASQFKNTPDRKPIRFENRQSKGEQSLIYSSAYNFNLAFSQRGSKMAMLI